jgi:aldehyde:ferredoxin oxidoreductase
MEEIIGTNNRVLEINLGTMTTNVVTISDEDRLMYMGGKGMAMKLIYDRIKPRVDPLGPENILVFETGVYMGTGAPCSGRFSAVTKSPLTGIMTHSSCGGPFGMALKTSGWDGLIITGKASNLMIIIIDSKGASFGDAKSLMGKDTVETQEMLDSRGSGMLVIGPAGENLIPLANVCSDHRYLGRGGMGAVMGSKNIKAIVAKGKECKITAKNKDVFDKLRKKANKYINSNLFTSGPYRDYGTSSAVDFYNAYGMMPVKNFTLGSHPEATSLSGQNMAKIFNSKFKGCMPCSILCGHAGTVDGRERIVPEYETVGLMGSNLMIFDPVVISEWNEICGRLGIDTISAGGTLGWAMEATEKGIFKSNLKFGKTEGIAEALNDMAHLKGIGKDLSMGSRSLSEKYGGKNFAIHVKGLELAAYDPRATFGMGLNYAVANRGGCHLSSTIMTQESKLHLLNRYSTRGKAIHVKKLENLYCGVNSMHTCHFTSYAYQLEVPFVKYSARKILYFFMQYLPEISEPMQDVSMWPKIWSSITGIKLSQRKFLEAGERIHILERYMNTREGISYKDDTLPGRMLNEGRDNGVPTDKILKKLKIVKF